MLIALTGLNPHTGVTTTAVALANAWPGTKPAVVVEADPAGGRLARLADADPHRGLASLAAATTQSPGDSPVSTQLWEHVQTLGSGVPFLAAPPSADAMAATLTAPVSMPAAAVPRLADLVVIADCGLADPASPATPIAAGADVLIVVVRGDLADPVRAGRRVREVTAGCRRGAVLLVGSDRTGEFAEPLGVPVLGRLPLDRLGAEALLTGARYSRRGRNGLAAAARVVAAALHTQLTPAHSNPLLGRQPSPWPRLPGRWRHGLGVCIRADSPRVYRARQPVPDRIPGQDAAPAVSPVDDLGLEVTETGQPPTETVPVARDATPVATTANESAPGGPTLAVEVFGPLRVCWHRDDGVVDITTHLQPRSRELLALLTLHPEGISREALIADLWGERCPRRPVNALNTAISRLTASIRDATDGTVPRILAGDHIRYQLDHTIIATDYQQFARAVRQRRHAGNGTERGEACRHIIDTSCRGILAADLTADWVAPIRESARRDTITAVGALAATVVEQDPRRALDLLETALDHDPLNELLWRDILRLHARLGEHTAIERTLGLLAHKLSKIGEEPTAETRDLAERLQKQARH